VNQNFSPTAIVGEVMCEMEDFFAEHVYEFVLLFLSKILASSLRAFSVLRLSAEISCVGFSLMSMVPAAMADVVLLLASPLTGMEMRDQSLLSDAFIVGKISEGNTLLLPRPCHSAPHIMVTKFIP